MILKSPLNICLSTTYITKSNLIIYEAISDINHNNVVSIDENLFFIEFVLITQRIINDPKFEVFSFIHTS